MRVMLILIVFICICWADSPAIPGDYISVSKNGEYIIVIFSDETVPQWSRVDNKIRESYKSAGVYKKDGTLMSKIDQHMWGAIVTNNGIGFGFGQWANKDDFEEIGYYICKDNKCLGSKVKDFIAHPEKLPNSISHYKSVYSIFYNTDLETVIVITYESQAIIYSAINGDPVDIKK